MMNAAQEQVSILHGFPNHASLYRGDDIPLGLYPQSFFVKEIVRVL